LVLLSASAYLLIRQIRVDSKSEFTVHCSLSTVNRQHHSGVTGNDRMAHAAFNLRKKECWRTLQKKFPYKMGTLNEVGKLKVKRTFCLGFIFYFYLSHHGCVLGLDSPSTTPLVFMFSAISRFPLSINHLY